MGKKKVKERRPYAGEVDQAREDKRKNQKKTYSLGQEDKRSSEQEYQEDGLFKVQIAPDKEESILNLILESKKNYKLDGSISKRLTTKKLTDLYNTLQNAGFKHSQIENAMSNTVQFGGDLIDALDWLCLNTQNDQLPEGFSQALIEQEQKSRPKFDAATTSVGIIESTTVAAAQSVPQQPVKEVSNDDSVSKDWILRYAEQSDEDDDLGMGDGDSFNVLEETDVNERYLELWAILEDIKVQAAEIKRSGNKTANKEISKKIRDLHLEIQGIERHSDFDKMLKVCGVVKESKENRLEQNAPAITEKIKLDSSDEEGAMGGFALFEEQAEAETPKEPKPATGKVEKLDIRNFEYTRKQWTGKSPKQFLIDWVRKHLPKSPPPKYHKVHVSGSLWRSRCVIVQKEGNLEVVPEIVCENMKDAEHLASILALYNLCKGQKIYQLLPPPYRDVWLEWQDAEDKQSQEKKEQQNKPRDQFVTKLMKKLKVADSIADEELKEDDSSDGLEESWENRLDEDSGDDFALTKKPSDKGLGLKTARVYSNDQLQSLLQRHHDTEKHKELLETRKQLPVYQYRKLLHQNLGLHVALYVLNQEESRLSVWPTGFVMKFENLALDHVDLCVDIRSGLK